MTRAQDLEGGVDALVIGADDAHADEGRVGGLDLVEIVDVHLHRVERTGGALPVRGVQVQPVHERIGREAHDQRVIGIPQVTVVVDPLRENRGLVDA